MDDILPFSNPYHNLPLFCIISRSKRSILFHDYTDYQAKKGAEANLGSLWGNGVTRKPSIR